MAGTSASQDVAVHGIQPKSLEDDFESPSVPIVVTCHENDVPSFAEKALDRIYGSIYSTVGMFRFDGSIATASTYVTTANGEPTSVLLYRRERHIVTVLNGSIKLPKAEIERFATTIFARYKRVSAIVFNAIQHDIDSTRFPFQCFRYGEDIVATLPDTPERYFASLGKNMRETIKRFQNRLKRNHPDFHFQVYVNDEANEAQIRDLYKLQRARIESKNKTSTVTDEEIERILVLVKTHGLVTIATIGGKVCGGMVCLRAGDNYFMRTIAHDPIYDDAKLGTLCCYYTICECIARGGKAFHFSPGRVLYKYRFLGVEQFFDRVVLYRSRMHMLLNARTVLSMTIDGKIRDFKMWLLDVKSGENAKSHASLRFLLAWRAAKKPGSLVARIAAVRAALRTHGDEMAETQLLLSTSPEANQEIKARRRAVTSTATASSEDKALESA